MQYYHVNTMTYKCGQILTGLSKMSDECHHVLPQLIGVGLEHGFGLFQYLKDYLVYLCEGTPTCNKGNFLVFTELTVIREVDVDGIIDLSLPTTNLPKTDSVWKVLGKNIQGHDTEKIQHLLYEIFFGRREYANIAISNARAYIPETIYDNRDYLIEQECSNYISTKNLNASALLELINYCRDKSNYNKED